MPYQNKRILFMGDSITAWGGWITHFNEIIKPAFFANIAVSGASWRDYPDTVYDKNPVCAGPDHNMNNTISNQVEKLLELKKQDRDFDDFDIIIISAGTNDTDVEGLYEDHDRMIASQFIKADKSAVKFEELNRQIWPGVMRAVYEILRKNYPNARIVYCAPIQAAEASRPYASIKAKGAYMQKICKRIADVYFVDTANCGICGIYEEKNENGRDLCDGLHPNANGEIKIGRYNANAIKKLYI